MMPTLVELRVARRWSQGKLAKRANISRLTVNRAEQGYGIYAETFQKICKALEVSPEEITGIIIYDPLAPNLKTRKEKP